MDCGFFLFLFVENSGVKFVKQRIAQNEPNNNVAKTWSLYSGDFGMEC